MTGDKSRNGIDVGGDKRWSTEKREGAGRKNLGINLKDRSYWL